MSTAPAPPDSPLACVAAAIDAAERPRYKNLRGRLLSAVREQRELPSGYAYRIDPEVISLLESAEWIALERKCCPFLTLELEVSGAQPDYWLRLSGPPGVKDFLAAELTAESG